MLKKIIAIILIALLLLNSVLMLTGKLEGFWFWVILSIIAVISHFFFKQNGTHNKK
jgi:hypothetical protein